MSKDKSTSIVLPDSNADISLETFKSMFYHLNAKPDTEIKLFKKPKLVYKNDITSLNDKVMSKLGNHNIVTAITSIVISFSKNKTLDISTWQEFVQLDFDLPNYTKYVEITWDFLVSMPNFKNPQRHTVKLRIGTSVKPSEMFHIMFEGESDFEVDEASSFAVLKVNYINQILSTELVNLVTDWYDSLTKPEKEERLSMWVSKHFRFIHNLVNLVANIAGVLVGLWLLRLVPMDLRPKEELLQVGAALAILWITVYIFGFLGNILDVHIQNKIDDIKDVQYFRLTKGDENKLTDNKRESGNIIRTIGFELAVTLVVDIVLAVLHLAS